MVIGEAPGAEEDRQGEPFVGRAGQLLTSMLRRSGSPGTTSTSPTCSSAGRRAIATRARGGALLPDYLDRQIELVKPTLILAVGRIAAQNLLATDMPLAKLRGHVHALGQRRRPVVVTYHPAYLLRPGEKRKAWEDLLLARGLVGRLERGENVLP